ncbi:serine (or cysteine) peptidase inhibitor, clade H, member 2 [Poeciliopsis prolifica]|uniref:serine (or cysteine) peptidase inhibitor, clade H, member 2 n=1 Tax=Poeciliopsis prolifica TaxID=188132 RepID=UPI00241374F8|nr:serine (or cysteine) peptidase inhibitor, clade H, member 2 [Poeciliopsis prolifica]
MLFRLAVFLLVSLLVFLVQSSTTESSKSPAASVSPSLRPLVNDPSWTLGVRLYQALRSDPSSVNTLFSPLLLASSLEAASEGSGGKTAEQIRELLKPPSGTKEAVGELLSLALTSLVKANGTSFQIHTSSGVFTKQAPAISQAFAKEIQSRFRLQHRTLGEGDAKADLKQLHEWAEAALSGKEMAPLEAEIKAKAGAMILTNALHFKGLWQWELSEESADRRTFLGKKYTKVIMMHRAGRYRFHEDVENMVQVLETTLWGGKASLVLLLPFHVENLARLDKLLTPELLSKWLERTAVTGVALSLPKANITSSLSLQKHLSSLGLSDAWDQKAADFSRMSDKSKGKLHLGGALHWASLELDPTAGEQDADLEEENIERPKLFYADHPFIIFVRDNATGALLLMGALDNVEEELLHDEL